MSTKHEAGAMRDRDIRNRTLKRLDETIKGREEVEALWPQISGGIFDESHLPSELQHIKSCLEEGSYVVPPQLVATAIMHRLGLP
jgi:hypothetical protein